MATLCQTRRKLKSKVDFSFLMLCVLWAVTPNGSRAESDRVSYLNETYGFSFSYPSVYNGIASCALKEKEEEGLSVVRLGNRVVLTVFSEQKLTLGGAIAKELDHLRDEGAQEIVVNEVHLPFGQAKSVTYGIGGMGRLTQEYWIAHHGNILRFAAMSGPPCVAGREETDDLEQIVASLTLF
ncbi:MAG: hypothetical protein PHW63_05885 [Alphaproteobacteria bacterium]|nr:hypothetical protein [Alphaproteobacteria bacterium]